jgi:predicted RNA binding protein YcfA (HicA-like mRNA interferase family)
MPKARQPKKTPKKVAKKKTPKVRPKPLKYRQLVRKLRKYGIRVIISRAKGSHRMLYQDSTTLNYPITCHSENEEYSKPVIKAIARRFSIPEHEIFA